MNYERLPGYERFDGREGMDASDPVPGVGPVLHVKRLNGDTIATRSDEHGEPKSYKATSEGWVPCELYP